jgi:hypothetical protein
MSFFSNLGAEIFGLLSGLGSDTLAAVKAFISIIIAGGGSVLVQSATDAVAAAEAAGGTGSQKLAAAQAAVTADLTSKGIVVLQNGVNAAIEAAVAQMKANQAPPSAVPTASPAPATPAAAS